MATYQSKFECGQSAWFMHYNKATRMRVGLVTLTSTTDEDGEPYHYHVQYGFRLPKLPNSMGPSPTWEYRPESEVFATKEELLASL